MDKKILKKIIFIAIIFTFFIILISQNQVNAVDIDENRYPGYKEAIERLENAYPNWKVKVFNTGLSWEEAVAGEYVGHGAEPSSLIQNTYSGEWICPICGDKLYDVSQEWHCASEKAIKYMMDPRNSLTEDYVFQFQDLGSPSGTKEEITKMVKGTFLQNDVDAIYNAAQKHSISPFHLVARMRLEQGVAGTGSMNGYPYKLEDGTYVTVYNLFNINVSGNSSEAGLLEGAKFAYEQGWTTRAASIEGGAKFLRQKYIDKGQSTLYFQKYNVVDKSNLYNHQYMQNIRAANDEGNIVYNGYKSNGILDSHFEFTIPLYENMPKTASPRPTKSNSYSADLGTEVIYMKTIKNISNKGYIVGEMYVSEFIDGKYWSIPKKLPIMRLKTEDGKYVKNIYVEKIEDNRYYFDIGIEGLDINQKYIIEVESGSTENTSPHKVGTAYFKDDITVGKHARSLVKVINAKIQFTPVEYRGDIGTGLIEFKMNKNTEGKTYVYGEVVINEWIDGICLKPDIIPSIKIKSTDGKEVYNCWVINTTANQYHFDSYIEGINADKEYILEAELKNSYNNSKYKNSNILKSNTEKLGKYDEYIVWLKDSKLKFELDTYIGDMGNEIIAMYLNKNSQGQYYISGNLYITEWINGTQWSIPKKTPKITIKTKQGQEIYNCWVNNVKGNEYYFDTYIDGIDTTQEYVIEIELASKANISSNKKGNAYFSKDLNLGEYKDTKMKVKQSVIIFQKTGYRGDIGQQLDWISLNKNAEGKSYINGNIYITEWIDGTKWSEPKETPKMKIKTTDGIEVFNAWVSKVNGNTYYFDTYIEGIDTTKEYVLEVELGGENNISDYKKANVTFGTKKTLGMYKEQNLIVEQNKIRFEGDTYRGDIGQQLDWIKLNKNAEGKSYINGNIYITEWINGTKWSVPNGIPSIVIKTSEGTKVYDAWVSNIGENKYYFDTYIEGIDTNQEYEIEIKLTNVNNVSVNNSAKINFGSKQELGQYGEYKVEVENTIMRFVNTIIKLQTIQEEITETQIVEEIKETINEGERITEEAENNDNKKDEEDEEIDESNDVIVEDEKKEETTIEEQ